VVVGWAAGPAADAIAGMPTPTVLRRGLAALARGLGTRERALAEALAGHRLYAWGRDPFARGAYTWIPAGAEDAPARLAAPVADTIFFAGEATEARGHLATVHGALRSGVRAADEIRARLGR
jgi:monoamine oxidase